MAPHRSLTDLRLPARHSMRALIFRFLHDGLCILPLCCEVSQMLKKEKEKKKKNKKKRVENGNGNKGERQIAPLKKSGKLQELALGDSQGNTFCRLYVRWRKKKKEKEKKRGGGGRGGEGEADGLSKFQVLAEWIDTLERHPRINSLICY